MATTSRHDAWAAGDSYDAYMGRWSRPIAARFLDWLALPGGLDWLELGCGTGALTSAIVRQCAPASVIALDPSEGFLVKARQNVDDPRVTLRVGDAGSLASLPTERDPSAQPGRGPVEPRSTRRAGNSTGSRVSVSVSRLRRVAR